MKTKSLILSILVLFSLSACKDKEEKAKEQSATEKVEQTKNNTQNTTTKITSHKVVIKEIIQANSYTYLRVKEDGQNELWITFPKSENNKVGETVYYGEAFEMKDFKSKDLNRTFESVYFIEGVSTEPIEDAAKKEQLKPKKPTLQKLNISVKALKDSISIADIYAKKDTLSGKKVIIRVQVTKVNVNILKKNWLHVQDGTKDGNNFDLTVTTDQTVKVGETVTLEGTVSLNKDYGYGYVYPVLLEDAKIKG